MPTLYSGIKSLDAEFILDFSNKAVTIDYTRNNHGNLLSSNNEIHYFSEWQDLKFSERLKQSIITSLIIIITKPLIFPFYSIITNLLQNYLGLHNETMQYLDQRFKKWVYVNLGGIIEIIKPVKSTNEIIHIPSNLWIQYEIHNDINSDLCKIKLIRHFDNFYRYGKYNEIRQNGWDVIFEFKEVPQDAHISLKYVG